MDNTQKSPNVLSLCTGYGGIELGLERALGKLNVLAHVEIEAFAIANLVAKMETGVLAPAPIWTNLKTFRPAVFRNCVDILSGGYPCQPFSAAGKRGGNKDPRHLWPWIKSAIKVIKPGMCFFENVEGHITLGLKEVLTDLVKLGYRVENDCGEPTWGLFSAAEVGAPHQRKRVFILAYSEHAIGRNAENWLQQAPEWSSCSGKIGETSFISGELANPRSTKPHRVSESEERRKDRTVGNSSFVMADSTGQGLERSSGLERQNTCRDTSERIGYDSSGCSCLSQRWPARPGQPQFEWEEPRVLADTKNANRGPRKETIEGYQGQRWDRPPNQSEWEIEPGVGLSINGNTNRVDELRLLGNGVVPDTAEKAFRTLYGRIINPDKNYIQPSIQLEMF